MSELPDLPPAPRHHRPLPPGGLESAMRDGRRRQVRFLGVTGHGTRVAAMHLASLERFPFDAVLLPYNFTMLAQPADAADVERLLALCAPRGVAVPPLEAIARRRWGAGNERRSSWNAPHRAAEALGRALRFVLSTPGLCLNTSSAAAPLLAALAAAEALAAPPTARELEADVARLELAPLFVRGVSDTI